MPVDKRWPITARQEFVMGLRSEGWTLQRIATLLNLKSRERIRQLSARGFRRLKHSVLCQPRKERSREIRVLHFKGICTPECFVKHCIDAENEIQNCRVITGTPLKGPFYAC